MPLTAAHLAARWRIITNALATCLPYPQQPAQTCTRTLEAKRATQHRGRTPDFTLHPSAHGCCKPRAGSRRPAAQVAFYLFWHVKPHWDRAYIVQEDLLGFLPPDKAVRAPAGPPGPAAIGCACRPCSKRRRRAAGSPLCGGAGAPGCISVHSVPCLACAWSGSHTRAHTRRWQAKAFAMLDCDSDGQVSLHDIRDAVLHVYRERAPQLWRSCMACTPHLGGSRAQTSCHASALLEQRRMHMTCNPVLVKHGAGVSWPSAAVCTSMQLGVAGCWRLRCDCLATVLSIHCSECSPCMHAVPSCRHCVQARTWPSSSRTAIALSPSWPQSLRWAPHPPQLPLPLHRAPPAGCPADPPPRAGGVPPDHDHLLCVRPLAAAADVLPAPAA